MRCSAIAWLNPPLCETSPTGPVRSGSARSALKVADAVAKVEHAVAVRAADEQATLGGQPLERGLARLAYRPGLAEAARQDDGGADAALDRRLQESRHLLGRDRHHHDIGGRGCGRQVGIAGQAEDVGIFRIDGEDAATVAEALQVGDDARRAPHALRGADHRDARRLHQWREIHGPSCRRGVVAPRDRTRAWVTRARRLSLQARRLSNARRAETEPRRWRLGPRR